VTTSRRLEFPYDDSGALGPPSPRWSGCCSPSCTGTRCSPSTPTPDLGDLKDKLSDDSAPAALVDDLASWLDGHPGATPAELSARLGVGPPRAAGHPDPPAPPPHFTWSNAPLSWREPVRELAARLANNWGTLD
jgi:hypothetical protein